MAFEAPSRARGTLAALALAAALVAGREARFAEVRYDRFHLPAFDGHMYVAMAEEPRFFTVAPWGYRVLLPWLVAAVPAPNPVPVFFWATVVCLTAAGTLMFLYLSHLGMGRGAALLGLAALLASQPVGEAVRYQFLVEPLTLALELAFLLALQAGAGPPLLALLALLGTLSKEFFLLLLPLVFLVRRGRAGNARAALEALAVAVPALAASAALRSWWTPHVPTPLPELPWLGAPLALERVRDTWREWGAATLLHGLTPLALLGALRARARPLLLPAAWLFLASLLAPLLNPVAFFSADVRRLLIYALPAVVPLALLALDRLRPHAGPPAPPWRVGRRRDQAATWATAALAIAPVLLVDRYRRLDLSGTSDALRALAVCRETLRTARELDGGGAFVFDATNGRFSQGVQDHASLVDLRRVRWFLAGGWGSEAHAQAGEAVIRDGEASLLVPCLRPRDLDVELTLRAAGAGRVAVHVNGQRLDDLAVSTGAAVHALRIPGRFLFRGDNLLALRPEGDAPGWLGLRGFRVRPAAGE